MECDTGSFLSTINVRDLDGIPGVKINSTNVRAKGYNNNAINFVGECTLSVAYKNIKLTHTFFIVDDNNVNLLGRDLCEKLGFCLKT